ncbi:MAG: aldo/keto reductase [Alphaproteobacteria bacterium]|nr:aldo/keto reductase [Alphaproteobacteria bacterium]
MTDEPENTNRPEGEGGFSSPACAAHEASPAYAGYASLPQRPFAATGKNVSLLGLGTVKFGRNTGVKYPGGDGFALPTDAQVEELLDTALACGINLLDTAPAYGVAEERLGKLLGKRRERFFLVTKTGEEFDGEKSEYVFTAEHTRMSVERSLKRLDTDFLDCVLVHSNREDVKVITQTPALETLARLKEEGLIGSFGVSTYTVEGGRLTVDMSDAVMVAYNAGYVDEKPVIDYAREKGKAVLVKKGLASGHAAGTAAQNIRLVTSTPGVTSLVFGSLNPKNILANAAAIGQN